MPQSLTTSKSPGDFANDGPYTHAKIAKFSIDLEVEQIRCRLVYGTMDGSNFVPSDPRREEVVTIQGSDYTDVIGVNSGQTYSDVKAALYSKIATLNSNFAGTVV